MPQVPKYGAPKVELTGLPNARFEARDNQVGAQAWGQALDNVGNASMRLAEAYKERATKERFAAFQAATITGHNQIEALLFRSIDTGDKDDPKGLLNMRGMAPHENLAKIMEHADQMNGELAANARTGDEQLWAQQEWIRRRAQFEQMGLQHAQQELRSYVDHEDDNAIASSVERGVLNAPLGPAGRQVMIEEMGRVEGLVRRKMQRAGFGPQDETTQQELDKVLGTFRVGVIHELLNKNQTGYALELWRGPNGNDGWGSVVKDMQLRQQLDTQMQEQTTVAKAKALVDPLWARFGPQTPFGAYDSAAILKAISEATKDDKAGYAAATAYYADVRQAEEDKRNQKDKQDLNGLLVDVYVKRTRGRDIYAGTAYNSASPEVRQSVAQQIEQRDAQETAARNAAESLVFTREAQAEARRDREQQGLERTLEVAYLEWSNPNKLRVLTDEGAQALSDKFRGTKYAALILEDYRRAKGLNRQPGAPIDSSVTKEDLIPAFKDFGFNYSPTDTLNNLGANNAAFVGRVLAQARIEVDAAQRKNGNERIAEQDRQKIIRDILSRQFKVNSGGGAIAHFFNGYGGTKHYAFEKVDFADLANAYVPIKEIDPRDRLAILARIRQRPYAQGTRDRDDNMALLRYGSIIEHVYALDMLRGQGQPISEKDVEWVLDNNKFLSERK